MRQPTPCPHTQAPRAFSDVGLIHTDDESRCFGDAGRILHLIPAPGWRAVHAGEQDGKAVLEECPLVAFALVEYCDSGRAVVPLAGSEDIETASTCSNFLLILGPGQTAGEWEQGLAETFVQKDRARGALRAAKPEAGGAR